MDMIDRKLSLSRQTLFRKLKAKGTTFEQASDELRRKLALHYSSGKERFDKAWQQPEPHRR